MNDRIKEAFDQVRAEEALKERTKAYLAKRTPRYSAHGRAVARVAFSAAACVLCFLLGFGGYHVYFTPTSVISIDINPSIELGINRFDKVISVDGYNEDGKRLAQSLNVRFMDYDRALERILENESVTDYLAKDELLSVVVVDSDEEQGLEMLANVEACVAGHGNAHCHSTGTGAVAGAHAAGFSYGKYLAFLELSSLAPEITAEEAQGMTMREIREMIEQLQPDGSGGGWTEVLPGESERHEEEAEHHEEKPEHYEEEPEHHEEKPEHYEEESGHHGEGTIGGYGGNSHGSSHGHGKE